ncbi:hypothetical protein ACFVYD_33265 [Streptomyces sp. NPDC058301]|uniref:hypothetical protein n=1 Tax=Streptomyces sp. NPDC058301 TaxID=3346436 RepID=UPI0036E708C8
MLLLAHATDVTAKGINPEAVPLADIQERLSVSRTTAGEIRQEAVTAIADGYRGDQAERDSKFDI